ncbi:hypothetical protein [Haladaptatus halobius]|uniref:hypothetical protein n=1 Tax=Haladaptatus halobius TaxID=2884875 RepID=UPI001D0B4A1A|nr:hypothetical protein [Haladaptatus halobius]
MVVLSPPVVSVAFCVVVVSADHGEFLGERLFPTPVQIYGHSDGVYMEEFVKVP